MEIDISTATYEVRKLSPHFKKISLGHTQQLIAAALGFQSLAAYQARIVNLPKSEGLTFTIQELDPTIFRRRALELIDDVDWVPYWVDLTTALHSLRRRVPRAYYRSLSHGPSAILKQLEIIMGHHARATTPVYLADDRSQFSRR